METNLIRVLDGDELDEITSELCDFTIAEQNAVAESQGITPRTSNYVPVLGSTVVYIVACVIINDNGEILMMQEAKKSTGKWYLPAGHLEKGENLVDGAKREVLEETGMNVDIKTLLAVEVAGGHWFRFIFTGDVIGGTLKDFPDNESLQAQWIKDVNSLSLRSDDILNVIELGRKYANRKSDELWHKEILPAFKPHDKGYLRLIIIVKKKSTNRVHVLLSEKNAYHFPTVEIHPDRNIHATLRKFMIELFGADLPPHRPSGILSVEYSPIGTPTNPTDGLCLSVLVPIRTNLEEVGLIGKCAWQELSKEVGNRLVSIVVSKTAVLGFHVVR
jgi:8-oxo-dGDP phosphatase